MLNVPVRDFPTELLGKADPQLYRRLNQLYELIYQLQQQLLQQQSQQSSQTQQAVTRQLQLAGLLGPLGQSLVGSNSTPDPQLQNVGTGNGTVTTFSSGNLSPLFTTSVVNAGTTPAISFAQVNQNANRIFAGPTTGAAAAPTFRALVADDLPIANLNIPDISTDTILTDAEDGFWVDASSGVVQVNLTPAATAQIKPYSFKKMDGSVNAMTIKVDGGTADTIDGSTSVTTIVQYTSFTMIPDPIAGTWNLV